ncbi:DUF2802 domain-containing protein [Thauera sp. CAU 1555]|uniref:DUF2802 domain-containing protein n=1 Tax=Thauera sedimentorum TaxID=2767595 RepID=A0ABR9BB37_9RHOO|nr:DUF2802 domain-containing protein [Thauera sedimentorum]MBC9072601.1 DUF2802 domain-containing protein [Thauera sedimentorum]MBD8503520.1 DUF2802 domain-containing protein [Thauera sedimentorum]
MVRVLLLLLVAVLLAYALWQLLHALRNRRREARPPTPAVVATDEDAEADDGDELDDGDEVDESAFNYAPVPRPDAPVAAAAVAASEGEQERFQQELELQQLRRDIARLQAQHAVQQREIADLNDALTALREQFEANLAGQGVSPEYNEALVFARRGLEADAIAERCGISVAEAELVRSMTRRGDTEQEDPA